MRFGKRHFNRRRRFDFEMNILIAVGDAILKERMTNDKRPGLVILTKLTNQQQFEILPEYGNFEIHFDLDNMSWH